MYRGELLKHGSKRRDVQGERHGSKRRAITERKKNGSEDPPLQVLEEMGDFLAGFFGVIDGDVLALLGPNGGIAANGFAGVHGGMAGNFEGFLGAIRGLHSDDFRTLADVFDGAFRGMDRFFAEPLNGMGGLFRAFASGVDDDVPAFLADKVGALSAILKAMATGFPVDFGLSNRPVAVLHGIVFCPAMIFSD